MLNRSTDIWERLSEVLGAENLDDVAHKLGLNASTLRGRKAREAIPYEQIVHNLDVYELAYVFKDKKLDKDVDLSQMIDSRDIKEANLGEFEQHLDELIQTIEKGPFSSTFKIRIVASLMRIADGNKQELQKEKNQVPVEEK